MSNLTLPLKKVAIVRGRETITTSVPKHEIRVLQVVHRPDNVREIELTEDEHDDIELDSSAGAEFARLQRKYRRINTPDAVLTAYPGGADDLTKFGFKAEGGATKAPGSKVRNRKAEAKKAAKKAGTEKPANDKAAAEKAAAEKAAAEKAAAEKAAAERAGGTQR